MCVSRRSRCPRETEGGERRRREGNPACHHEVKTSDILTGLVIGVVLFLGAAQLASVCLWWRIGTSASARWWVRREPIEHRRTYPFSEGIALVLLPVMAETLAMLDVVAVLGPVVAPLEGVTLVAALGAVLFQAALYVIAHVATWQRWILPVWAYPAWLRETRRRERALLAPGER